MALLILLICLGLQRHLRFYNDHSLDQWFMHYDRWIFNKFKPIILHHNLLGLLIFILPVLALLSLIESLSFHLLGPAGEYVFSLVLLWLCMGDRNLHEENCATQQAGHILTLAYQRLFAIIFWFMVCMYLGIMPALIIYPLLISLSQFYQVGIAEQGSHHLLNKVQQLLMIVDWVPVRLMGLSFALAGHFTAVFILWRQQLQFHTKVSTGELIQEWGMAAIQGEVAKMNTETVASHLSVSMMKLVNRALILWLTVLGLFTLGNILILLSH